MLGRYTTCVDLDRLTSPLRRLLERCVSIAGHRRSGNKHEMSNLSSLANVSIAKDKYIARLQQRMPMAIQALAATIATRATSSSSDTRREKSGTL